MRDSIGSSWRLTADLSTIRKADLVLLMEDGRNIERGNHEKLMDKRGAYYEMVLRQMHSHSEEGVLQG